MRGVTLEEISAATRIAPRFLAALESEQWELLPGGVFNRGFIRSVARYLGLDEDTLVAEYALETRGRTDPGVVADPPEEKDRNWARVFVVMVLALLLVGGGWAAVHFLGPKIAARLHKHSGEPVNSAPDGGAGPNLAAAADAQTLSPTASSQSPGSASAPDPANAPPSDPAISPEFRSWRRGRFVRISNGADAGFEAFGGKGCGSESDCGWQAALRWAHGCAAGVQVHGGGFAGGFLERIERDCAGAERADDRCRRTAGAAERSNSDAERFEDCGRRSPLALRYERRCVQGTRGRSKNLRCAREPSRLRRKIARNCWRY